MRHHAAGSAALLCALLLCAPAHADKRKIAVMDLMADTRLDAGIVKTLNEILLNEFTNEASLDVLGSSDIATMLTLEEERIKLTGCADDSCLAEIGGALGVQLIGAARVGAVGEKYVVSIKVLDVNGATVLGRTSEMVEKNDTELIAAIQRAVATVLGKLTGQPAADEPAAEGTLTAAPAAEPSTGFWDVSPWVGLGLTVALGGTAAALAGVAYKDSKDAQDAFVGSPAWRDAKDAMESKALAADVLFGVAGAAAVATVLLFVLAPDDVPPASAGVIPVRGGGAATLTVRFR